MCMLASRTSTQYMVIRVVHRAFHGSEIFTKQSDPVVPSVMYQEIG